MLNFCTLFDSMYMSRGIAMYESLKHHYDDFHLYIYAFDNKCYEILKKLNLSKVTIIPLDKFEDKELLNIKNTRTQKEYCWTCSPSVILYSINTYNLDMCTYLDADLYFLNSPKILIDEMQDKSVLITGLRFTPRYDISHLIGKYCVQFMTFKNNTDGLKVLRWWRDACIEWCYDHYEDGKYGDQKYLDNWTTMFNGIHELEHLGGGMAPWNIQQYNVYKKNGLIYGKEKKTNKEFEAVFYHIQGLRFYDNGHMEFGLAELPKKALELIYKPYIIKIEKVKEKINSIDSSFDPHGSTKQLTNWKTPIKRIHRLLRNTYNIYDKKKFISN